MTGLLLFAAGVVVGMLAGLAVARPLTVRLEPPENPGPQPGGPDWEPPQYQKPKTKTMWDRES